MTRGGLWSAVRLQVAIGAAGDDGHLALLTQVSPLFIQMANYAAPSSKTFCATTAPDLWGHLMWGPAYKMFFLLFQGMTCEVAGTTRYIC